MIRIIFYSILFFNFAFSEASIPTTFSYLSLDNTLKIPDQLLQKKHQSKFKPLLKEHSKFGFINKIFWIKVNTKNNTFEQKEVVLELNHPSLDYIDIYEENKNQLILKKKLGDLRPYDTSAYMPNPTYITTLLPNENKNIYVRVQSQGTINLGISLDEIHTYTKKSNLQIKWITFYIGAVFIMLIYNFIIFFITKNMNFFYYVIFHMFYLLFALSLSGIAFEIFWPNYPLINRYIIPLTIPLVGIFSIKFTIGFLSIKENNNTLYRLLQSLIILCIITLFLPFISNYSIAIIAGSILSITIAIVLLFSILHLYISKKNINALLYLIAWGFFAIGVLIAQFSNIGLITSSIYTNFASQIGSFFEVLLLSISLAYYYNHLQTEHKELTNINKTLQHLSNTDALTQSYNRRYFFTEVSTLLKQMTHDDFFLLMFDLDYFKHINDTYGHKIGDEVLQSVTVICQNKIKNKDIFARYGGEEFVLFIEKSTYEQINMLIKTIQQDIKQININSISTLNLTVSIGISQKDKNLEVLLAHADKALYTAKNSGRNTFCFYKDISK